MTSGGWTRSCLGHFLPEYKHLINRKRARFRAEIALTDGRVMGISQELNSTEEEEEDLKERLTDLENELRDIRETLARNQQQLENYLTSGFTGTGVNT